MFVIETPSCTGQRADFVVFGIRTGIVALSALLMACSERQPGADRTAKPALPAVDVAAAPTSAAARELSSPLGQASEPAEPIPHYSSYVRTMPELPGVVSWKKLAQVQIEPGAQQVPRFEPEVARLDAQQVKLQGFMLPLEVGEKHKRFILAALPPSCSFCLPGGPESVVEVVAREPIKFTNEPLVVAGRFSVLKSDPLGLYYRLTEARPASPD